MLVRDFKRLSLLAGPLFVIVYLTFTLFSRHDGVQSRVGSSWLGPSRTSHVDEGISQAKAPELFPGDSPPPLVEVPQEATPTPAPAKGPASVAVDNVFLSQIATTHQVVFSSSTLDKKYFNIDLRDLKGINPNIIPHPTLDETWIVVAQEDKTDNTKPFVELACNAVFRQGQLRCVQQPTALPISPTTGGKCEGDLSYFNLNVGPHDARVFYGPDAPYTVFGSNSDYTCFGQWVQDFRSLVDWGNDKIVPTLFKAGTELQRPLPYHEIEKNYFLFWDPDGNMYAQFDVMPKRVFSKVEADGSVGPDLAPAAAASDEKCLTKYMPQLPADFESIHQATNSLKITLCKRAEPSCKPTAANTFLFTIFQHKKFYNFHGVYEPYLMVFKQEAPFQIHAISKKPLWIHGRERQPEKDTSDMLYVTSMSWKSRTLKYHGYLDDELFLAFGFEDRSSAGIDVVAGDLIEGLGLCDGL